jgi:hypothetical protein
LPGGVSPRPQSHPKCPLYIGPAPAPKQAISLGATSLARLMQVVANRYGMTPLPKVAIEVEASHTSPSPDMPPIAMTWSVISSRDASMHFRRLHDKRSTAARPFRGVASLIFSAPED